MGCCNEMDWSDCDMSAEHHPACPSLAVVIPGLAIYSFDIGLSGEINTVYVSRDSMIYLVVLTHTIYLNSGSYYFVVLTFVPMGQPFKAAIYLASDKSKSMDVEVLNISSVSL